VRLKQSVLIACTLIATPLLAADRLTDRDVKSLVSRIEDGRDRFDNALDGRQKRTIVRGPAGEIDVQRFLDDFQESIDRLEERLRPDYAASAEAAALLRQGSAIDRFFRQQPAGTKGESEWNRLATDLKALAIAYGADFPLSEGATVRRLGDGEVAAAAEAIARAAERLKQALDKDLKRDPTVQKPAREAIVLEANLLSKDAKALRGRVNDSKPSSAEADRLLGRAEKLRAFMERHQVPTASSAWAGVAAAVDTVAAAYRTTAGTTR
jgi:hypothetical protein